jgi:hypothetical protein
MADDEFLGDQLSLRKLVAKPGTDLDMPLMVRMADHGSRPLTLRLRYQAVGLAALTVFRSWR